MTKETRASRREAARRADAKPAASRWLLPAAGLAIAAVAVIAIVLSQGSGETAPGAGGSAAASGSAAAGAGSSGPGSAPVITGTPLPDYTGTLPDAAKGVAAPVVDGHDYAGAPVSIAPSGRVTVVVFAAHWCPHCQREIPLIQAWVNAGGLPSDVDMISVSTAIDPARPNYPPQDWLEREGWTAPVIVDPTDSVAAAYGLTGYPYFVILDGAGNVFARTSGEIPMDALEDVLATVPRG